MTGDYRSRFAGFSPRQACFVLLALMAIIVATFIPHNAPAQLSRTTQPAPIVQPERDADLALYNAITARVAMGEPYYPAAADALRKGNYPLRPFVTFRLPTLAVISATIGPVTTRFVLWALMLATLFAWYYRLDGTFADPGRRISGVLLLATGMTVAIRPEYVVVHEVWAGLLLALSLAVHRYRRWWPSVVIAFAAVIIRELALPFLLLMFAFAAVRRSWIEAAAWAAAIALFALVLGLHANQVAAVVVASDPASPGWLALGGWQAFLRAMAETSALRVFPAPVAALFVITALFGWLSWPTRTGLFGTLLFAGYGLFFMILGRSENFYWGLIVSPLLMLGLAHVPQACADLGRAIGWTRARRPV